MFGVDTVLLPRGNGAERMKKISIHFLIIPQHLFFALEYFFFSTWENVKITLWLRFHDWCCLLEVQSSSKLRSDLQFPAGWFRKFRICSLLTSFELVHGIKLAASTWEWRQKRHGIPRGIQIARTMSAEFGSMKLLHKINKMRSTFLLFFEFHQIPITSHGAYCDFSLTWKQKKLEWKQSWAKRKIWKIYEKIEKFIPTVDDVDGPSFQCFIVCVTKSYEIFDIIAMIAEDEWWLKSENWHGKNSNQYWIWQNHQGTAECIHGRWSMIFGWIIMLMLRRMWSTHVCWLKHRLIIWKLA